MTGGVPAVAGKEPLLRLAPEAAPIDAQLFEQLGAEHDIAVLAALSFPDMNHHRSEEHTSELQSLRHLVCRLLLEKKTHHLPCPLAVALPGHLHTSRAPPPAT